jgi:membrane-bound lytic murein transglycosylase B
VPAAPVSRRTVFVLLALAAVCVVIGWVVLAQLSWQMPTGRAVRPADVSPGTPVASVAPLPGGLSDAELERWAERTEPSADVPARALRAYAAAELSVRRSDPGCRLSWATLAGIGRVESDHGRISGGEVRADGSMSEPIIGVALDGSGPVAAVPDSDGGRLDGDPGQDRAVGPMQFIPSSWQRWAVDANGDGWRDPQNIDDAALAAARYLCEGGRNMASGSGWWDGVLTYNRSVRYGQQVYAIADGLAKGNS